MAPMLAILHLPIFIYQRIPLRILDWKCQRAAGWLMRSAVNDIIDMMAILKVVSNGI